MKKTRIPVLPEHLFDMRPTPEQEPGVPAELKADDAQAQRRPRFPKDEGFHAEVRRRVETYFKSTGRRERDCPRMYLKTGVILTWWAASYALLVFVAATW